MEIIYAVLGTNKFSKNTYVWRAFKESSKEEMEQYIDRLTKEYPEENFFIDKVHLF